VDYTSIYKIFYPTYTEQTFSLAAHGIFSGIDHILGHKANINKYRKIEITCILSDHNGVKTKTIKSETIKKLKHMETK
jgi:hypothetical protein